MANVLPIDAQKRVWAMYRSRLVLVTALVLLGLAFAAALTLIPSIVALQVAAPSSEDNMTAVEVERESAIALERGQFLVNELKPYMIVGSSTMRVVEEALDSRPVGVKVTRIIYIGGETDRLTFIGTGSREGVSAYKDALAALGRFDGVAVPVSALVGSEGGGFSVVLTGQF